MGDWGGASGTADGLLAETLGLAMARRAADVLSRHRDAPTGASGSAGTGGPAGPSGLTRVDGLTEADARTRADGLTEADATRVAAEDAVFTAVLNAANECLGRFDARPPADRWCDALLSLLRLADSPR